MEFFKPGRQFDFMVAAGLDPAVLFLLSPRRPPLLSGPNYGTDFRGGTEVEIAFTTSRSTPASAPAVESRASPRPTW